MMTIEDPGTVKAHSLLLVCVAPQAWHQPSPTSTGRVFRRRQAHASLTLILVCRPCCAGGAADPTACFALPFSGPG